MLGTSTEFKAGLTETGMGRVFARLFRLLCHLLLAALIGCGTPQAALACMPGAPGDYDRPTAEEALAVLASVEAYEFVATAAHVCMRTSYAMREVFLGAAEGIVETEVCLPNDGYVEVGEDGLFEKSDEMVEYEQLAGFYPGALVVTLLTSQKTPGRLFPDLTSGTKYRPAITSCWMYHQMNVGVLSEPERAKTIERITSEIASQFGGIGITETGQ